MISNNKGKNIYIHITTYHNEDIKLQTERRNMNEDFNNRRNHKTQNSKFICSICLNTRPDLDKNTTETCRRKASCPVCQRHCGASDYNAEKKEKPKELVKTNTVFAKSNINFAKPNTKTIQTSQTDVTDGLNLLNEVLTVFRSKKEIDTSKENSKTIIFKDACVATECFVRSDSIRPKLTVSKIFKFSIEEEVVAHGCFKYTILNSCQPEVFKNFIKHKSLSVPQIKMDELKYSLKEKTKSKDTIEEVNRMFATVRKVDHSQDDTNRPIVRSGPRVLPVVKTKNYKSPLNNDSKVKVYQCNARQKCQCCQTNNYYMSGGDSFRKNECCQLKESATRGCNNETCDKCVYMMSCPYKNHLREEQAGFRICECCKSKTKEFCNRDKKDDLEEEGSTSF